jgi:hypothetical protein
MFMSSAGLEHKISTNEKPHAHAFDRAATGIGLNEVKAKKIVSF